MSICRVCHFETVEDDIAVQGGDGQVVCLCCYETLTETRMPTPKALRNEVEALLAELPVGSSGQS